MNRINKERVVIISISWMFIGVFLSIFDHFSILSHFISEVDSSYNFWNILVFHSTAGLTGGFVGGMVLIHVNERFRSEPYYKGLAVIVFFFLVITGSITVLTSALPAMLEYKFLSTEWKRVFNGKLLTTFHLKNSIFWACIVGLTYFFLQMSNKFGPGNLVKVITGTYNVPKTENRVFMFLDLKSSTSIAENLGSEKYHQFLKDVFADITDSIMKSNGDIYQYVGDEIVISWPASDEGAENCLKCFFGINQKLSELRESYQAKYRELPVFKAGAHYGEVIAGEIGIIKRDITYSGDILNTTARIQSKCNELGSRFLISESLKDLLSTTGFRITSVGNIELRGKRESLELFSVIEAA